MKLSTGKIKIPLEFENGDIEYIELNPHDSELQKRIKNFENSLKKRFDKINAEKFKNVTIENTIDLDFDKLVKMSPEELKKLEEQTNAIIDMDAEYEQKVCEELDSIFDCDFSKKAFKYVKPLNLVEDGKGGAEMYIMQVLQAVGEELQKYGNKMNNATKKYIEKYPKKV